MKIRLLSLFCVAIFIISCIHISPIASAASDRKSPSLVSVTPKDRQANISVSSSITVKFSENILEGTVFSKIKLVGSDKKAVSLISTISKDALIIKPEAAFSYSRDYTLTIPAKAVKDKAGNYFGKTIVLRFKTRSKAPATPKPTPLPSVTQLHAFYPAYISFKTEYEEQVKKLNSISFAWGTLEYNGTVSLNTTKGQNENDSFYFPQDFELPLEYAMNNNIPAQFSIYADSKAAGQILPYKDKADAAINLIAEMVTREIDIQGKPFSFNGVVLDFEGLKDTDAKGKTILIGGKSISWHYSQFIKNLSSRLKQKGKVLYTAVHPKTYFNGYNYSEIIKYSDKVILMAHDYEPRSSLLKSDIMKYLNYSTSNSIRSLAPIKDVDRGLKELKKAVRSSADVKKIWLQISFGTAQWQFNVKDSKAWNSLSSSALGKYVNPSPSYGLIKSRLDNKDGLGINIVKGYIKELESPYITYYNSSSKTFNFILYEDSTSVAAKINQARLNGITGISLWSVGVIPNCNDKVGIKYNLNVWQKLREQLKR